MIDSKVLAALCYGAAIVIAAIAAINAYYAEVNDKRKIAKYTIVVAFILCTILLATAHIFII